MKWIFAIAVVVSLTSVLAFRSDAQDSGRVAFKTPQEAVKYYEDLVGSLAVQVRSMQDENARLASEINSLKEQVQGLSHTNQAMSQDIESFKRQIVSDTEARQAQVGRLIDRAVKETAGTVRSSPGGSSGSDVECVEYIVQKGATLSAISKAYDVSIDEIKRVNNLRSDMLREGQKLLIPKK